MNATGFLERCQRRVAHWHQLSVLGAGVVMTLLLGIMDYLTGYELSFAFFYILPVSFVAYFANFKLAVAASCVSAVTWCMANHFAGEQFSNPAAPYWNTVVRLGFFLFSSLLVSRMRDALERERQLARRDPLTEAMNSRAFFEVVEAEIQRAGRYGHPFTMAYIDLDNFKTINDTFGHRTGDQLLRTVAQTLSSSLRRTDIVARLGGDEFALLLPELDAEPARYVLQKLQGAVLEEMLRHNWPVTLSIGALVCTSARNTTEQLIHQADALMYDVKKTGKDGIRLEVC